MSKFDWDSKRNQKVIKAIPGADRLSKMAYGAVLKNSIIHMILIIIFIIYGL